MIFIIIIVNILFQVMELHFMGLVLVYNSVNVHIIIIIFFLITFFNTIIIIIIIIFYINLK